MINLDDIVQLVLLCAIIFLPLGYGLHRLFPHGWRNIKNRFLSPRYLQSAGLWSRDGSTSQTKRKKPQ